MRNNQPIAAVLLAGGLGRRIGGGDKPLRSLAGRPLLDHVLDRMRPQVGALVLSANGDPARFAAWGLEVVADPLPDYPGPLAGVLAGMRWAAARGFSDIVSVPTDTPFLPPDLVARLAAGREAAGLPLACASSLGRTHPVVGLWRVALAEELEAALRAGMRRIDRWTAGQGIVAVTFAAPPDPFFNVNSPEDLAEAERLLDARSTGDEP
jgi:molybdopterin-guanine dinucleotide biosynthesis protein A